MHSVIPYEGAIVTQVPTIREYPSRISAARAAGRPPAALAT